MDLLFKSQSKIPILTKIISTEFHPRVSRVLKEETKKKNSHSMEPQQRPVETPSDSSSCFSSSMTSNDARREKNIKPVKFSLTFWEMAGASSVALGFAVGLIGVYLSLPDSDYSFLKLPTTLEELRDLRDNLESYTCDYTVQVLVGYCTVYIFMQTFMIPGTVFMSLLAGSLFGVLKGLALVVFAATAGASSCYFLSHLIGRPLILALWPDKIVYFQDQVAKRQSRLLNYMLFLRVTPTFPNAFINVASPIVNVPYHTFLAATSLGLIPVAFVTVKAGMALGELQSVRDLYDVQSVGTLFLIGVASVIPTLISNKEES